MAKSSQTLVSLIADIASRGEKPALVEFTRDDKRPTSYGELGKQVERLAAGLQVLDGEIGVQTAVMGPLNRAWITAALATIGAGRVLVPLDVQLADDVLEGVLEDSGARLIFTTAEQAERLDEISLPDDLQVALLDEDADVERSWLNLFADEKGNLPDVEPDDTAILFYTSGTTGPPKGVPLTHANVVFELDALREAKLVSEEDRVLVPLPGHHVYPLVIGILTPLALGIPIVLPASLTGPQIQRALREGEATVIIGVPRLYEAVMKGIETQAAGRGRIASALFRGMHALASQLPRRASIAVGRVLFRPLHKKIGPKLRVLASGGSPLDPQLAHRLEALGWQVAIGYGLTETSPLATLNPPGRGKLETVGHAVPGVEIRIDPSARPGAKSEARHPTPDTRHPHEEGEILLRGPNVFAGYYHLPEKTEEAFTDGWFRTGDLGYLDADGYLRVTGRVSTVIVTKSGKNVQPDEVEEKYAASEAIREMGILEEEGELVAVVVPDAKVVREHRDGNGDLSKALRTAIKERSSKLPSYQRIRDFAVWQESLPRTRLGKLQRHELADLYQKIRSGEIDEPEAEPMAINEMSAEDRTLLEDPAARQTWELLAERHANQRLTPDTDMRMELDIDSMEWLNLTLEVRQRAGVEIDDEAIGRVEAVRDLLREVAGARGVTDASKDILEEPERELSERQKRHLQPRGPFRAALARSGYAGVRGLMSLAFRVEVKGAEHLPDDQFIITPNHVSLLDPPAVATGLDWRRLERVYWGGFTGITFTNPLMRGVSRLAQVIPVDPKKGVLSSLAFAAAVLKKGDSLIWFPEGERSADGELRDFKPGIGLLLTHYPVTVVPAWVEGTFESLPMGKFWPRFRKVRVIFGEPIPAEELVPEGAAEEQDPSKQREIHAQIAQELRKRVADLAR